MPVTSKRHENEVHEHQIFYHISCMRNSCSYLQDSFYFVAPRQPFSSYWMRRTRAVEKSKVYFYLCYARLNGNGITNIISSCSSLHSSACVYVELSKVRNLLYKYNDDTLTFPCLRNRNDSKMRMHGLTTRKKPSLSLVHFQSCKHGEQNNPQTHQENSKQSNHDNNSIYSK